MRSVYLDTKSNQFFNVENLALKDYGNHEKWNGLHVENILVKHLYGIMMWDEIYFPHVKHVFQTPYQFGPLDFYEPDFYKHRKPLIDAKLTHIETMNRD
jgi:hypothetical protein